jgi:GT2 family glycosyltransferase
MSTAVLVVNYRTYGDLRRCLASLVPYLETSDELVVVDYESDALGLAEAVRTTPARTVALKDNLGFAAGVNIAAAASTAPFLLLLNPDTIVEGPVIRTLENWLASNPSVGVAGPRVHNADGTVQPTARRFPDLTTWFGGRTTWLTRRFPQNWFSRRNLVARDAVEPVDVDWVSGTCLLTRRDLFERIGGFDESFFLYWEDADYCQRAATAGFRRTYVPGVSVRHFAGRSAAGDLPQAIRAFHRSAYRLYKKRASRLGRVVAPLVRAGLLVRGEFLARRAARNRVAGALRQQPEPHS